MSNINETLYINFSSILTFLIGNLFSRFYDSRWFVSPYIHSTCLIKIQMGILSNALKIFLLKDHSLTSYDLGSVMFIIIKFMWLHGFHILVHVIFIIEQTAPCWDQINKIIWVAHLLQKLFAIVSLIPISTVQDFPLHYYSLLEIGMSVISIHIYLICIFVVNGSRPSKDSKVTGKRNKWDLPLRGMGLHFSQKQKWPNGYQTIFSLWWSGVLIPRMAMMT